MSKLDQRLQELGAAGGVDVMERTGSSAPAGRSGGSGTARTPQEDPRIRATPGM